MIDPAIRKLLRGPLDTLEKIEVGMALYRAPGRSLSMSDLAQSLALEPEQLRRGLEDLQHVKLASEVGGRVRLAIRTADESAFRSLADLHARDPAEIAAIVSEATREKIRSMAAQTFVEAFAAKKVGET